MILKFITPQEETFNLRVSFPKDYTGKQVHYLFYIEEEAENVSVPTLPDKKPSDFFGIFNKEDADRFEKHTLQMRNELEVHKVFGN